jgi:methionyl-tRNA formyltransferase
MQKMKIVFMGTPDFAVPSFCAIANSGIEISAVFTQPDKASGRRMRMNYSPVKKKALEYAVPVYQPQSLRRGEDAVQALEVLKELQPDCIVVAAYGQILPEEILNLPKYGCINVHASLLPKYRGAAPIQRCILDGEKETGVTIMQMAKGLDTGDMLLQGSVEIGADETAAQLHDRLAELGARLVTEALELLPEGKLRPEKQDDALSCYAAMITKEMSSLDFTRPALILHRTICALTGFTSLDGKRLKVFGSRVCDGTGNAPCGTITDPENMTVQCGEGTLLRFTEVQLEGGKRLPTETFLRGKKLEKGQQLGE